MNKKKCSVASFVMVNIVMHVSTCVYVNHTCHTVMQQCAHFIVLRSTIYLSATPLRNYHRTMHRSLATPN